MPTAKLLIFMAKAKLIENLDCGQSAEVGARAVLGVRCAEMYALRDAALEWSDIEGVHDMRVASRRLRSHLQDFMPYLSGARDLKRSRQELRALAGALGAVRDQDVAIEALQGLQQDEAQDDATDIAAGIELFVAARETAREEARGVLVEMLEPSRLAALQNDFNERLERATQTRNVDAHTLSFAAAGAQVVLRRYKELARLSRSLYRPFAIEPLHEMRIAAKRLRYAVELFAECSGNGQSDGRTDELADQVAELQSALGGVHDCDVWIAEFGELLFAQSKRETKRIKTKSARGNIKSAIELAMNVRETGGEHEVENKRRAAVWLLAHFTKERTRQYRRALELWQTWRDEDFASKLVAQFNATKSMVQ